jgi:hypothetical protein
MIPLFLGITTINLLALAVATVLGYLVSSGRSDLAPWHQLAGALAAIECVAVHCIVFTYFIATAKWIQHAVSVKHLDPQLSTPTRSFKAQAFPAALSAMTIVFATAVVGVLTLSYGMNSIWHHAMALASLAVNVVVAFIEFRAISRNGALIDDVLARASSMSSV